MTEVNISVDEFAKDKIRKQILQLVKEYSALEFSPKKFIPGQTMVPPSGKLIDSKELENMDC
jgi:CDP-6-deoxy-D-xylo-4-hexulose-3-dehydrase